MIAVKLYGSDGRTLEQVGMLEFFGTPVAKADGSSWLEFEGNDEPCAGQVQLDPAGIATGAEIRAVADSLCRNEVRGQAGRYEWVLTAGPTEEGSRR
jgi:hypothetical protein